MLLKMTATTRSKSRKGAVQVEDLPCFLPKRSMMSPASSKHSGLQQAEHCFPTILPLSSSRTHWIQDFVSRPNCFPPYRESFKVRLTSLLTMCLGPASQRQMSPVSRSHLQNPLRSVYEPDHRSNVPCFEPTSIQNFLRICYVVSIIGIFSRNAALHGRGMSRWYKHSIVFWRNKDTSICLQDTPQNLMEAPHSTSFSCSRIQFSWCGGHGDVLLTDLFHSQMSPSESFPHILCKSRCRPACDDVFFTCEIDVQLRARKSDGAMSE